MFNFSFRLTAVAFVVIFISSCSEAQVPENSFSSNASTQTSIVLDVHKSPSCGCCGKWIEHINEHGLQTKVHNSNELPALKNKYGISAKYRSCHTAISKNGYIFEGHIPAKFINKFLTEHHENVIGLSVPAMPLGSPGMEVEDKFMPYKILRLKKDGTHDVYHQINRYEEQF